VARSVSSSPSNRACGAPAHGLPTSFTVRHTPLPARPSRTDGRRPAAGTAAVGVGGTGTENAELAQAFIENTIIGNGGVAPRAAHADRGTSMTSKPVAALLADLHITQSHSRPHVSKLEMSGSSSVSATSITCSASGRSPRSRRASPTRVDFSRDIQCRLCPGEFGGQSLVLGSQSLVLHFRSAAWWAAGGLVCGSVGCVFVAFPAPVFPVGVVEPPGSTARPVQSDR